MQLVKNTLMENVISGKHPVQVHRWPSNLAPWIKTKFLDFSREI